MEAQPSPAQTDELLKLAEARFPSLSEAEKELLRAAPRATSQDEVAWCGPSPSDDDPERSIRAELLRWLCVNEQAKKRVDPKGIQVHAARIDGGLDLSSVTVPFPLALWRCRLADGATLRAAEIPHLDLQGSWVRTLNAGGINVKGSVFLRNGFSAAGEVRLLGAQIGGDLNCEGGTFKNPPLEDAKGKPVAGSGTALSADGINVTGSVFLRNGFSAAGEVRLLGAQIGGYLVCEGGMFKNPALKASDGKLLAGSGKALNADGINVKGDVFLRGRFAAEGEVRLLGAQIGGDLDCEGGTFKNPPLEDGKGKPVEGSGDALSADRIKVTGGVLLRNGFSAEGEVRLLGAKIEGEVDCEGGTFTGAKLDLRNASAAAIVDGAESWPEKGNLRLDGFVYQRFSGDQTPKTADERLKWLDRQQRFTPQPYRQLAKVLKEAGDDSGARRVLYEMERRAGGESEPQLFERACMRVSSWILHGPLKPLWTWLLKWTIGYGRYPGRAVLWLGVLTLAGTVLFGLGYLGGSMTPTERDAYASFEKEGWPPRHYQQFNPLVYSLENSAPLLRLGQDSAWAPDPGPPDQEHPGTVNQPWLKSVASLSARSVPACVTKASFLRFFRWSQIVLGWILATLFVAGVTGIVRRD